MSEIIKVLQLGNEDWNGCYQMPENVQINYAKAISDIQEKSYNIVFIDGEVSDDIVSLLQRIVNAYTLFLTERTVLTDAVEYLSACKVGKHLECRQIQDFLLQEAGNYFSNPHGAKMKMRYLTIAQGFAGSIYWDGNYSVTLEGEYGKKLNQIVYWNQNLLIEKGQAKEFWLEYAKDDGVEIALSITQFARGSIAQVQHKWLFSEKELTDAVIIDNINGDGYLFVSVHAKGTGKLKLVALHFRNSRKKHGLFLPGGKRYVTAKREEIFYYFSPGDRKPPLNVYFSGYKTLQGFEGYPMMWNMGCPFLLISEPRLEGGCFYMGDEEYEAAFPKIIRSCMEELGFSNEQVIMAGVSMGSFGALYYGCDILPHAMIVGKPLLSIGTVAANERLNRPGGFPTSLDVLNYIGAGMDKATVDQLNQRFWKKFEATSWEYSKFILAYMIEDDYENSAYNMLVSHLHDNEVQLYGKGIHGRHNDAGREIARWFKAQYRKVLYEDFDRG